MTDIKQILVPDMGDFDNVPVIEVLVAVGDQVEKDQSLITLESDKATMEVPSPFSGTIQSLEVKEGDNVEQGTLIATIQADASEAEPAKQEAPAPAAEKTCQRATSRCGDTCSTCI